MCPFIIKKKFTPEYPVSLVGQTTEFLTNAIIEGRFGSGEKLIENELQRQFGITGPIREAFRILERNGLVVTVPRKGYICSKDHKKAY
jgi:DNA-binding GntR family transcriptional regulator